MEFMPEHASAMSSWYGPMMSTTPLRAIGYPRAKSTLSTREDTSCLSGSSNWSMIDPGTGIRKNRKRMGNQKRRKSGRGSSNSAMPKSTGICDPTSNWKNSWEWPMAYIRRSRTKSTTPGMDTPAGGACRKRSRSRQISHSDTMRMSGPWALSGLP